MNYFINYQRDNCFLGKTLKIILKLKENFEKQGLYRVKS